MRTRATTSTTLADSHSDDSKSDTDIESQLGSVLQGIKRMKKQLKHLRKENEELQEKLQLEAQAEASTSNRRRNNVSSDSKKVKELEKEVKELVAMQKKDKKKIKKLQDQAMKAEAENLQDGTGGDENEIDSIYKMKKLLRKFSDLMSVATLEGDKKETCPVCFEELALNKTSSFQCEHLICNECLPMISKGADETVQCPNCRQVSPRDSVELVHYTEQGRWDDLLKVAEAWCAMDRRGEAETSEEEGEEEFINDGTSRSASSAPDENEADPEPNAEGDEPAQDEAEGGQDESEEEPSTPPPTEESQSYNRSPAKEKRKRMQQLAEDRQRKKGRHY
ncbi:hypothetical protein VKT23_001918 [Stygiomarasmius scandens]|uniref:RING-type domain-containing protein n=1 Tax=Marasmiellus scandens TaxID=2682957 RepID=A0ABR1K4G9_9AGAR